MWRKPSLGPLQQIWCEYVDLKCQQKASKTDSRFLESPIISSFSKIYLTGKIYKWVLFFSILCTCD